MKSDNIKEHKIGRGETVQEKSENLSSRQIHQKPSDRVGALDQKPEQNESGVDDYSGMSRDADMGGDRDHGPINGNTTMGTQAVDRKKRSDQKVNMEDVPAGGSSDRSFGNDGGRSGGSNSGTGQVSGIGGLNDTSRNPSKGSADRDLDQGPDRSNMAGGDVGVSTGVRGTGVTGRGHQGTSTGMEQGESDITSGNIPSSLDDEDSEEEKKAAS